MTCIFTSVEPVSDGDAVSIKAHLPQSKVTCYAILVMLWACKTCKNNTNNYRKRTPNAEQSPYSITLKISRGRLQWPLSCIQSKEHVNHCAHPAIETCALLYPPMPMHADMQTLHARL